MLGIAAGAFIACSAAAPAPGSSAPVASELAPGLGVVSALETDVIGWSADGGRLALALDDGVYVAPVSDLAQRERIVRTGLGHPVTQLAWSPDGCRIAFVSTRPGDRWQTIWLADADGSHLRDLLPPDAPFGSPGTRSVAIGRWLGGDEIAFVAGCGTECLQVATVDVAHGTYAALCTANGSVVWSRDGSVAAAEGHLGALALLRGADRRPIVASGSHLQAPCPELVPSCSSGAPSDIRAWNAFDAWSPDGSRFLFTAWVPGPACAYDPPRRPRPALFVWDVAAAKARRVAADAAWGAWSPDGSWIAFLRLTPTDVGRKRGGVPHPPGPGCAATLVVVNAESGTTRAGVPLGTLDPCDPTAHGSASDPMHPRWSFDGRSVAVVGADGSTLLLGADGLTRRALTRGVAAAVAWSPDGRYIALRPAGRFRAPPQATGLEAVLPPIGKEDGGSSRRGRGRELLPARRGWRSAGVCPRTWVPPRLCRCAVGPQQPRGGRTAVPRRHHAAAGVPGRLRQVCEVPGLHRAPARGSGAHRVEPRMEDPAARTATGVAKPGRHGGWRAGQRPHDARPDPGARAAGVHAHVQRGRLSQHDRPAGLRENVASAFAAALVPREGVTSRLAVAPLVRPAYLLPGRSAGGARRARGW